jgi:hypothetical protein
MMGSKEIRHGTMIQRLNLNSNERKKTDLPSTTARRLALEQHWHVTKHLNLAEGIQLSEVGVAL